MQGLRGKAVSVSRTTLAVVQMVAGRIHQAKQQLRQQEEEEDGWAQQGEAQVSLLEMAQGLSRSEAAKFFYQV